MGKVQIVAPSHELWPLPVNLELWSLLWAGAVVPFYELELWSPHLSLKLWFPTLSHSSSFLLELADGGAELSMEDFLMLDSSFSLLWAAIFPTASSPEVPGCAWQRFCLSCWGQEKSGRFWAWENWFSRMDFPPPTWGRFFIPAGNGTVAHIRDEKTEVKQSSFAKVLKPEC